MNLADLPTFHNEDIDKLKAKLEAFCEQQHISKFEADDIVELLEDGESVQWIVEQLQGDSPELDVDATSKLLSAIRVIVGPAEEDDDVNVEEPEAAVAEDDVTATSTESMDLSSIDLSQIDMSQLGDMLPKGMKLPKGLDMNQLQAIMESPQGKFMTDFTIFCQEQGVDIASMNDPEQIQQLEAQWKVTPRPTFEGKTPAEMLEADPGLMPRKVVTYRRDEPRIGRNDPCPCGSGKKYKKCCGRGK